ncbi:hypothetical protein AHAS_Ahas14G0202400 [Arachis hypogaea]
MPLSALVIIDKLKACISVNGGVLAIADGVSGWAEEDVDPLLFPRELMAVQRIAKVAQPDAIRAAFAEFFSMLIFDFVAEGSGMSNKAP